MQKQCSLNTVSPRDMCTQQVSLTCVCKALARSDQQRGGHTDAQEQANLCGNSAKLYNANCLQCM